MTQVKTFIIKSNNRLQLQMLDDAINSFLSQNDVEVLDIKYASSLAVDSGGKLYYDYSAMLIYKDNR